LIWVNRHKWNYFPICRFRDRAMGPRGTSHRLNGLSGVARCAGAVLFEQLRNEARQRVAGPLTKTGTAPLRAARPMFLATIRPKASVALISSNLLATAPTDSAGPIAADPCLLCCALRT
jgi:hypothetical protein